PEAQQRSALILITTADKKLLQVRLVPILLQKSAILVARGLAEFYGTASDDPPLGSGRHLTGEP
ncbi:MAG: hypothetical protein WCD75_01510, partial [Rhodoplanes sp.]